VQHKGVALHFGNMDSLSRYSSQQVLSVFKDSDILLGFII